MYLKEDNENEILQDYVKEQDTQIQLSLMGQGEWQQLTGDWNIPEIELYTKTPTTIDNSNQQSNKKNFCQLQGY